MPRQRMGQSSLSAPPRNNGGPAARCAWSLPSPLPSRNRSRPRLIA
jgi:hypothetical protein